MRFIRRGWEKLALFDLKKTKFGSGVEMDTAFDKPSST